MVATNMCDVLWDQNEPWLLCSEVVTCVVILALVAVEMYIKCTATPGKKVPRSKSNY